VDVHWREHVLVRQIDGTTPQPAQRFAPETLVAWVAKQAAQADVARTWSIAATNPGRAVSCRTAGWWA